METRYQQNNPVVMKKLGKPLLRMLTKKTALVDGVSPFTANLLLGDNIYGPWGVRAFARQYPNIYNGPDMPFHKVVHVGFVISMDTPLRNFVSNGNLHISVRSSDEYREIIVPADKLARQILDKENIRLFIKSGCTIEMNRNNNYLVTFEKEALYCLRQHIQIFDKPQELRYSDFAVRQASNFGAVKCIYVYDHQFEKDISEQNEGWQNFLMDGSDLGGHCCALVDATSLAELANMIKKRANEKGINEINAPEFFCPY